MIEIYEGSAEDGGETVWPGMWLRLHKFQCGQNMPSDGHDGLSLS